MLILRICKDGWNDERNWSLSIAFDTIFVVWFLSGRQLWLLSGLVSSFEFFHLDLGLLLGYRLECRSFEKLVPLELISILFPPKEIPLLTTPSQLVNASQVKPIRPTEWTHFITRNDHYRMHVSRNQIKSYAILPSPFLPSIEIARDEMLTMTFCFCFSWCMIWISITIYCSYSTTKVVISITLVYSKSRIQIVQLHRGDDGWKGSHAAKYWTPPAVARGSIQFKKCLRLVLFHRGVDWHLPFHMFFLILSTSVLSPCPYAHNLNRWEQADRDDELDRVSRLAFYSSESADFAKFQIYLNFRESRFTYFRLILTSPQLRYLRTCQPRGTKKHQNLQSFA